MSIPWAGRGRATCSIICEMVISSAWVGEQASIRWFKHSSPSRAYDVKVAPILGGVQGRATTDVNYLVAQLAERLGGKAYRLHAPAFVDTREHRDMLQSVGPIKEILDIARQANIALLGVGTVEPDESRFVEFTALSAEDMNRIADTCGGVGEIGAHVYDIEGKPCAEEYAERVVGLSLQELERIPFVIGVAATAAKALPLYGALRGGYLHTLITDEAAARGVLQLFDRDSHGSVRRYSSQQWRKPDSCMGAAPETRIEHMATTERTDIKEEESVLTDEKQDLLAELGHEKLAWMLQKMCETRYFEEKAEELYIRGLVHGTMHLSIGMEASPVGSVSALDPDDLIIHHHRGHGHSIAKGADITIMMAEFLGKEPGYCRGRGGSMHIADIPGGNLGATGVVASGIPTAVGIGLALQMQRSEQVLLSFFGDGATNLGEFHESLNMASVWDLPIVFICDNNQYGMSMAAQRSMNIDASPPVPSPMGFRGKASTATTCWLCTACGEQYATVEGATQQYVLLTPRARRPR